VSSSPSCVSISSVSTSVFSPLRPPPLSTLFPYTTLFRSWCIAAPGTTIMSTGFSPGDYEDRLNQVALALANATKAGLGGSVHARSEEHTSELQSRENLVCRLLLEKKKSLSRRSFARSTQS